MRRLSLARQRQIFVWGTLATLILGGLWVWSPGLPVIWGPSARASHVAEGRELFEHEWTRNDPLAHGDGLGPVFNAKSCASCHFQGGLGGGGEIAHNATTYEIVPRPCDPEFRTGTLHAFSVTPDHQESLAVLKRVYPVIPGREIIDPSCTSMKFTDFDPVNTDTVNPTALFGSGWIDLISDKAIRHNHRTRHVNALSREMGSHDFGTIPVGRVPVTEDGRVGKFGWKGQFNNLPDFVAAACANELGLGTPHVPQAAPLSASGYESPPDLDKKQFRSLVAFVKMLPKPVESGTGGEPAARGKELFQSVGCAVCHVPDMGGVKGVYSDFLLYNLLDPPGPGSGGNYRAEPPRPLRLRERPDHLPKPEEWKTPPLWGVADSAPYFHDGGAPTLESAISRHRGEAKGVTARYQELRNSDQAAVIAFLKTLRAPPDALPLRDPAVTRLKR